MAIPAGLPDAQQLILIEKDAQRKRHDEGHPSGAVFAARGERIGPAHARRAVARKYVPQAVAAVGSGRALSAGLRTRRFADHHVAMPSAIRSMGSDGRSAPAILMTFLLCSTSGNHSTATKSNPKEPACLTHSPLRQARGRARLPRASRRRYPGRRGAIVRYKPCWNVVMPDAKSRRWAEPRAMRRVARMIEPIRAVLHSRYSAVPANGGK